jgi:hypothetical protein
MVVQWFGVGLALTTLVALVACLALLVLALGRVRQREATAGLLLAGAALTEGAALCGGLLVAVFSSLLASRLGDGQSLILALNAWSLARPLLHGAALLAAALAAWRLTK